MELDALANVMKSRVCKRSWTQQLHRKGNLRLELLAISIRYRVVMISIFPVTMMMGKWWRFVNSVLRIVCIRTWACRDLTWLHPFLFKFVSDQANTKRKYTTDFGWMSVEDGWKCDSEIITELNNSIPSWNMFAWMGGWMDLWTLWAIPSHQKHESVERKRVGWL